MKRLLSAAPLLVVAALAAPGCATAMLSEAARPAAAVRAREVFGDVEQLQFAKQIQVVLPARLAVADVSADAEDHRRRRRAQTIEALATDTETWSDVGSLHLWSDDRAPGQSWFEFYRVAASRQQSDLLLVAERRESLRAEGNGFRWLNLLILPIFLVPTEDVTTTVDVHCAAVDVRNGLVYATLDHHTEKETSSTYAGRASNHRRQADEIFSETLPKLRESLARKLRLLQR